MWLRPAPPLLFKVRLRSPAKAKDARAFTMSPACSVIAVVGVVGIIIIAIVIVVIFGVIVVVQSVLLRRLK